MAMVPHDVFQHKLPPLVATGEKRTACLTFSLTISLANDATSNLGILEWRKAF